MTAERCSSPGESCSSETTRGQPSSSTGSGRSSRTTTKRSTTPASRRGTSSASRRAKKKDLAEPWVEAPALVLPDGKSVPLTADALKGIARVEGEDDAIGLGRGFRSHSRWAGASLAALLRAKLPAGTDSGLLFVVVTGSDGYRSLYSGGEVLLSRLPENVVLVDTEDGKPLLKKSGRLKSLPRGDFFADRDVRTVSEVRVLLAR